METLAVVDASQALIVFHVGELLCCARITHVQEITQNCEMTPVHHAPECVNGVVNLRGQIVTVIDLRKTFGLERLELHPEMRIVVVRFAEERIGLLVERVQDVMQADHYDIEAPPGNVCGVSGAFFREPRYLASNALLQMRSPCPVGDYLATLPAHL